MTRPPSGSGGRGAVALGCRGPPPRCLDLAVPGRSVRLEAREQTLGGGCHLGDRIGEGLLVDPRGLREAADLAHVLERGRLDLLTGGRRLAVVEGSDVPAHAASVAARKTPRGAVDVGAPR